MFPLNPDYVAARSPRSLRSNHFMDWPTDGLDGWTGHFMDWIKNRQTKYFMDWPYGGKYGKDTLWTGLTEERQTGYFMDWFTDGQADWIRVLYGLAHRQMGWILIFMDWPTNGTTL